MAVGYASGKVILFGEHAVVYGRPAIAVPVAQVQARAEVENAERGQGITIIATDLGQTYRLSEAPTDNALRTTVISTLERISVGLGQDLTITVSSTIPVARGLGSGAAVSAAIVRALLEHFDKWLDSRAISDLVFETEKIHHGTPSGIDNTVIAFEKPVYFVKGERMEIFWVQRPFLLVIADTGVQSPTKVAVGDVRQAWEKDLVRYEDLFEDIGTIADMGRRAIEQGDIEAMGRLMNENQRLLRLLKVSSPELEGLIGAAQQGGALGAKLSGAGRGGNMIALVTQKTCSQVSMMLRLAGAKNVIVTEVS
jgi:mevalonate kinase